MMKHIVPPAERLAGFLLAPMFGGDLPVSGTYVCPKFTLSGKGKVQPKKFRRKFSEMIYITLTKPGNVNNFAHERNAAREGFTYDKQSVRRSRTPHEVGGGESEWAERSVGAGAKERREE